MISVLPASFEPRRKDSWGSGMPLDTPRRALNMISVLPVTPKPCRKHNWGSGMPLDTTSKDPKHDFGAASHPQAASKGQLGCWNAAECPFEGPST